MFFEKLLPFVFGIMLATIFHTANAQAARSNQQTADSVFIDGHVIDERKEGMMGAIVELKIENGTTISGVATNEDGYFHLYLPPVTSENGYLRVLYGNYKTSTIAVDSLKSPLVVQMKLKKKRDQIDGCGYYKVPLIDPYAPTQRSITTEEIEKIPH